MPTLLAACDIPARPGVEFDGQDILPLLLGKGGHDSPRSFYFQWDGGNEGNVPRNFAVREGQFKLVHAVRPRAAADVEAPYELYDLEKDPAEAHDLSLENPDKLAALKKNYLDWFERVRQGVDRDLPRIALGRDDRAVFLSLEDRRGVKKDDPESGHWELDVKRQGSYEVIVRLRTPVPIRKGGHAKMRMGDIVQEKNIGMEEWEVRFDLKAVPGGPTSLELEVESDQKPAEIDFIEVLRRPSSSGNQ